VADPGACQEQEEADNCSNGRNGCREAQDKPEGAAHSSEKRARCPPTHYPVRNFSSRLRKKPQRKSDREKARFYPPGTKDSHRSCSSQRGVTDISRFEKRFFRTSLSMGFDFVYLPPFIPSRRRFERARIISRSRSPQDIGQSLGQSIIRG